MTEYAAQSAGEGQPLFLVHRDLGDPLKLVLDGVFNSDDLVFLVLDLVERSIEGRRFSGTRRSGDQHHTVGLRDVLAESLQILRSKPDNVQIQFAKGFVYLLLVKDSDYHVLAVDRRHDGNTEINLASANHDSKTAILRYPALSNVQLRHYLYALHDSLMVSNVDGIGGPI